MPHEGLDNFCGFMAISTMGFLFPLFQSLIACMAIDAYNKIVRGMRNTTHHWKAYVAGAVVLTALGKTLPFYVLLDGAGFNNYDGCDYSGEFMADRGLWGGLAAYGIEFSACVLSLGLFIRISVEIVRSTRRVQNASEGSMKATMKTLRMVRIPTIFVVVNTILMASLITVKLVWMSIDVDKVAEMLVTPEYLDACSQATSFFGTEDEIAKCTKFALERDDGELEFTIQQVRERGEASLRRKWKVVVAWHGGWLGAEDHIGGDTENRTAPEARSGSCERWCILSDAASRRHLSTTG